MWHNTVEVERFASAAEREQAAHNQVEEILERLHAQAPVAAARDTASEAKQLTRRLKQSQTELMARAGRTAEEIRRVSEKLELQLTDDQPIKTGLAELMRLEAEHRLVTRANRRLAEERIPNAEISEMQETAAFLLAQASALREEARIRLEKTAQLISQAAEFEGNITFNPAHTVSGALATRAEALETEADNYRRWAAERAERHHKLLAQIGA